jgi:hypothetical protein
VLRARKKIWKNIDIVAERLESSTKLDRGTQKMKTPALIVSLLLITFAIAPQNLNAQSSNNYSAKLISPRLGQVLHPGEQFTIEWAATLPNNKNLHLCEMELRLSLDGGRTFSTWITTELPPNTTHFDWTVPNTTNTAVLSVNFGCELYYPETFSPQPASTFVIASVARVH